jgi:hypothetical protein
MADRIQFERRTEVAGFFSPLSGMEFAEDRVEIRTDPLTGMTAVASAGLEAKEEMFLGRTDWPYTDLLVARSREGCFFCPEKVLEATPRYPDELTPGGRLSHGRALVFPNLFPLARVHAVVTFPDKHFLRPSEFTPSLLEEGLGAALDLKFVLWVVVQWVILFVARFPFGMWDIVAGYVRWYTRVSAYALGLVDRYPPFSMRPSVAGGPGAQPSTPPPPPMAQTWPPAQGASPAAPPPPPPQTPPAPQTPAPQTPAPLPPQQGEAEQPQRPAPAPPEPPHSPHAGEA